MKRCVVLILMMLCALPSFAISAADKLSERLSGIQTLRAHYVQRTTDPRFKQTKTLSGAAILRRPKMFRWQVLEPYRQLLVSDGEQLFIYDEDLEQVTVQKLGESLKDTPALLIVGNASDIEAHFKVREITGDIMTDSFELIPKDDSNLLKRVVLTFTGSILTSLLMEDNMDQIIEITFSEVSINDPLPQDLFRFKMPKNVDVIHNE